MRAEKGGPKIIQQANAVKKSTEVRINNLYFLDKLLNADKLLNITQFYFKKLCVYIILINIK